MDDIENDKELKKMVEDAMPKAGKMPGIEATDPILTLKCGAVVHFSVDLLALYTRLWPTGAQLRHHYWLGACSSAMTTCMRRYIANGPPHTSHGTVRLTEWADSGTGSGDTW